MVLLFALVIAVLAILYTQPRRLLDLGRRFAPGVEYYRHTRKKVIALTIDDAPASPATTGAILDVLERNGVTATFFCMSNNAERFPDIMDRIVGEGHEVGHHMTRDTPSVKLTSAVFGERFDKALRTLESFLDLPEGETLRWYRPAGGFYSQDMVRYVRSRGLRLALGDVFPWDTNIPSPVYAYTHILEGVRPGSIIVLHDGLERGPRAVRTLELVLPVLKQRGYEIVSLSEMYAR